MHNYQPISKGKEFETVFAGNSIIMLESGKTGRQFVYKFIRYASCNYKFYIRCYENTPKLTHGMAIGVVNSNTLTLHLCSMTPDDIPEVLALDYFLRHFDNLPKNLKVFVDHSRCRVCGRPFRTGYKNKNGIGVRCLSKVKHNV